MMECLLETKASTIVDFIRGLLGNLSLTFEEGTSELKDEVNPHSDGSLYWESAITSAGSLMTLIRSARGNPETGS